MTGKKFARITLILTAVLLSSVATVNILIDPLFQYHKPWFGMEPVITNERYQNAGVIKNFDFDNVILGTSLSENFLVSDVNDTFGGKSVKLTMSGSSTYNMTYQMELIKKRGLCPNIILCDMDPVLFESPTDTVKNPLPIYLYNDYFTDDVEYLFNFAILDDFTYPTVMLNFNGSVPDYNKVFVWSDEIKSTKELLLQRYTRLDIVTEQPDVDSYVERTRKNVELLTQYAEEMSDTTFVFFFAPIGMLYWDNQMRLNNISMQKAAYLESCRILTSFDNVKLYMWTDDDMFDAMSNLDNYVDEAHYNGKISAEILRRIKMNQGVITRDNYMAETDKLFKFIENFDYESLFLT